MARTGKWWAHQHFKGVVPDIMLFAKGIASGFPFAGIAAKPEMYQGLPTGSLVGYVSPSHALLALLPPHTVRPCKPAIPSCSRLPPLLGMLLCASCLICYRREGIDNVTAVGWFQQFLVTIP